MEDEEIEKLEEKYEHRYDDLLRELRFNSEIDTKTYELIEKIVRDFEFSEELKKK